jgi:hypothetical protein
MPSESCFMFANERAAIPQRHGSHRLAYIESLEGSAIDDKQHRAERKYLIQFVVIRKQCKGTTGQDQELGNSL